MYKSAYLIAYRYLWYNQADTAIKAVRRTCMIAIGVSAFALTLTIAIMNGFHHALYTTMQGIHPQLIIDAHGQPLDGTALKNIIMTQHKNLIATVSPSVTMHVLITNTPDNTPTVGMLKGIDPATADKVTNINKHLLYHQPTIIAHHLQTPESIIIGKGLADQYNLMIGDTIIILYNDYETNTHTKISFKSVPFVIQNIFYSGIDEFDNHLVLISLDQLHRLDVDTDPTQLELLLKPSIDPSTTTVTLTNSLKLHVYSWQEMYQPIMAALALERYAMLIILAIVAFITATNISGFLYMLITQKKIDIALLYAMGIESRQLQTIFIIIGSILSITASIVGIASAWIISILITTYQLIPLPNLYYVTHVTATMNFTTALYIFIGLFITSLMATIIPTLNISTTSVTKILRYDS